MWRADSWTLPDDSPLDQRPMQEIFEDAREWLHGLVAESRENRSP